MLFVWLGRAVFWVLRLFLPFLPKPPTGDPHAIDLNRRCEACGHRGLSAKYVVVSPKPGSGSAMRRGLLRMTCPICGAFFHLDPLYAKRTNPRPVGADEVGGNEVRGMTA